MPVGKIQRIPQGLLQFLGMVGTGVPPTDMADDVRAIFDMAPFYGAGILTSDSASGPVTNPGDVVSLAVPNGEAWYMLAAEAAVQTTTVLDRAGFSVNLRINSTRAIRMVADDDVQNFNNAAVGLAVCYSFPQPILLRPGNSLEFRLDQENFVAGGPRTATISSLIYRFEL